MSSYVFYDIATGRVTKCMSCREATANLNLQPNEALLAHSWLDSTTHYILGGVSTPRPENPATLNKSTIAADGVDAATLTSIPAGSTVTVLGPATSSTTVDDGDLEITADVPGTYRVTVHSFPEQDLEVTLVAA